jgi:hypothetical protein
MQFPCGEQVRKKRRVYRPRSTQSGQGYDAGLLPLAQRAALIECRGLYREPLKERVKNVFLIEEPPSLRILQIPGLCRALQGNSVRPLRR